VDDVCLRMVRSHFDCLLDVGLDVYGSQRTPMWPASLDVRRGGQYEGILAAPPTTVQR